MEERDDPVAPRPEGSPEPRGHESNPTPAERADGDELEVLARLLREDEERDERGVEYVGSEEEEIVLVEEESVGVFAGRFELQDSLGGGPHGEVFRARDLDNQGRVVALKLLEELAPGESEEVGAELAAWFEASRALPKDGENPVRETGIHDGHPWICSDIVDGENARGLVDRIGALPPRQALEIAHQVLMTLERARADRPHGRLVAENVLLANRVAWSEENPFGVGVRLTDHGLVPHLFPHEASDARKDLLAVGVLLAELLTGMRFAADAADWIGSEASASTAALSPAARRLLDRANASAPEERFPDAASFRAAIESTSEWRPKSSARTGRWVAVTLVALAIAGYGLRREIGAAFAAPPRSETDSALAAERVQEAQEAAAREQTRRAALEAEKVRLEGEVSQLSDEVSRSRSETESLRDSGANLAARATEAELQRAQLDSDLENTRLRLGEESAARRAAEEARLASEAKAREAEQRTAEELERLRQARLDLEAGEPNAVAAEAAGRFLAHLGAGDTAGAGQIAGTIEDGHALASIAAAVAAVTAAEAEGDALRVATLLESAHASIERAHTALAGLRAAAPPWLDYNVAAGDDSAAAEGESGPTLGVRLATSLDAADAREVELERGVQAELEARFEERTAGRWPSPGEVTELAAALGGNRLETLLQGYAAALDACEEDDTLDLDALAAIPNVRAWADFLAGDPRWSEWLDRVQPFALARALWIDAAGPFPRQRAGAPAPTPGNWREDALLRGRLLEPSAGFPGPIGMSALYHARTIDGEESWRWDRIFADPNPPPGVDGSRILEQRFHDVNGVERGSRRIRILRIGTRLFEQDISRSELLDLSEPMRAGKDGEIETWQVPTTLTPPQRLLVHPMALRAFREQLQASPLRAVRVERGAVESFYSPEYGLLRREDPAHIVIELIFAEKP